MKRKIIKGLAGTAVLAITLFFVGIQLTSCEEHRTIGAPEPPSRDQTDPDFIELEEANTTDSVRTEPAETTDSLMVDSISATEE